MAKRTLIIRIERILSGGSTPHERSIRVNPINPRSKKLSGEMNTDYKDITDEKISINKNKQIYFSLFFFILMFYSKMTNNHKIWLEANTERSESNPKLGNRE